MVGFISSAISLRVSARLFSSLSKKVIICFNNCSIVWYELALRRFSWRQMKVVEISAFGAPEVLKIAERPLPVLKAGEVLVKVAASGVNRPDVLQRLGKYPPPPGVTDIPGLELSGSIVSGDLAHSGNQFGLAVGDNVCALVAGGSYAEYAAVPVGQCLPVPKGMDMVSAAALPETFFTVWGAVFDRAGLGKGPRGAAETLLVHGGTSGIGVTAIQMATAMGHRVIATTRSDAKSASCKELGAAVAINSATTDFPTAVKEATGGAGVDVVLDMVAGDFIARDLACLADDGRVVIIAVQGGTAATVDCGLILRRRQTVTGATLRVRSVEFKTGLAAQLHRHVWPLLEAGKINPVIHAKFAASDAAAAHADLERNEHVGKIVLTWD